MSEPTSIPNSVNPLRLKPLPLLYTYRRCPYAMRARMALLVAKRRFNAYEIVLRDKPAAMLALSPKGTVPLLLLDDGQVLDESWDIMRWALDTQADTDTDSDSHADTTQSWWRLAQTAQNLDLLQRNDGEFKRLLDRYKYPERHASAGVTRNITRAEAVASFLDPLEARLQSHAYLGGATPCATDLAVFPFVRQFAAVEPHWFASLAPPAVRAWLAAWLNKPLFEACMLKLPAESVLNFPAVRD
jgi:glutathione S-transferase